MTSQNLFDKALSNAIFWQNRCCDLEEIIELFCDDADTYAENMLEAAPSTSPPTEAQLDELAHVAACYHDYSSLRDRLAEVFKGGA